MINQLPIAVLTLDTMRQPSKTLTITTGRRLLSSCVKVDILALDSHNLGLHQVRPAHPDLGPYQSLSDLHNFGSALVQEAENHVVPSTRLLKHPHT